MESFKALQLTSNKNPWEPTNIHDMEVTKDNYLKFCSQKHIRANIGTRVMSPDIQRVAPYLLYPGGGIVKRTLQVTTLFGNSSTLY